MFYPPSSIALSLYPACNLPRDYAQVGVARCLHRQYPFSRSPLPAEVEAGHPSAYRQTDDGSATSLRNPYRQGLSYHVECFFRLLTYPPFPPPWRISTDLLPFDSHGPLPRRFSILPCGIFTLGPSSLYRSFPRIPFDFSLLTIPPPPFLHPLARRV